MTVLPGLLLALALAFAGQFLSTFIGIDLMGLPKSPISAIMMAIILGIIIRNTISLPAALQPGIRFGLVRVLRLGIVLLGIRLSLSEAGAIGLQALPVIIGAVAAALLIVTFLAQADGAERQARDPDRRWHEYLWRDRHRCDGTDDRGQG